MEYTEKEIKILSFFEHGFDKARGIQYLVKKGFNEEELLKTIAKLMDNQDLDEVVTPIGVMLCTLYINFTINEFSRMKQI